MPPSNSNPHNTNRVPALFAVSNVDGKTPVYLWADPTTHGLVVEATASIDAQSIPATGLTEAIAVQIVDGSGNQITSFGGGGDINLTQVGGANITLGQKAMAASLPVVFASDQSTLTVDTELPTATALTDGMANPTAPAVGAFLMGWDGGDWGRVLAVDSLADGKPPSDPGLVVNSRLMLFNGSTWDRVRGDTTNGIDVDVTRLPSGTVAAAVNQVSTPVFTRETSAAFTQNQVSVATTATQIAPANPNRQRLLVIQHGTTDVFLGPSGVTTANGLLLAGVKGNQIVIKSDEAVYGIVGAGTQTISFLEETVA